MSDVFIRAKAKRDNLFIFINAKTGIVTQFSVHCLYTTVGVKMEAGWLVGWGGCYV